MKVLITGASGFVGKQISQLLIKNNHSINILSRFAKEANNSFVWNVDKGEIDIKAFEGVEAVIHLAGANIGEQKWTEARKKELENSRIRSTQLLYKAISQLEIKPKVFVSASAVGYYGAITSSKIFDETAASASDFLGTLCQKWEDEVFKIETLGLRCVALRTGVVLGKNEGALSKMISPVQSFLSVILGLGDQIMPWVSIYDLCNAYLFSIENTHMKGAYNVVAPDISSYQQLMKSYSDYKKQNPIQLKVPTWVLKIILGDMHQLLCYGSAVCSQKIQNEGFTYKYPKLTDVFKEIYG